MSIDPENKHSKNKVWRILIPVLILLAAGGIYLLKNPIGSAAESTLAGSGSGQKATAEFDLDATAEFDLEKILSYGLPVIVDFGADSCIPCKEMAPVLAALNQELRGKAIVKFVDVWKNTTASQEVPLQVIPTQFFFNADGTPYVPADEEAAAKNGVIGVRRSQVY